MLRGKERRDELKSRVSSLYDYEKGLDKNYKKSYGVVYTPFKMAVNMCEMALASYIKNVTGVEQEGLEDKEVYALVRDMKVLDMCTGTGVFIVAFLSVIAEIYEKSGETFGDKEATDWFRNSFYASDIDSKALESAKESLGSLFGIDREVLDRNMVVGDSLFNKHGIKRLVPVYNKSDRYWSMLRDTESLEDEFGSFEGVNVAELYREYLDGKGKGVGGKGSLAGKGFENKRYEYLEYCLSCNGISLDGWDKTDLPLCYELEFLDVFFNKDGFDIVIGNPPYVAANNIIGNLNELSVYKSFSLNTDLSIYFYERGYELLNKDGVLCMIGGNSWISAKYADGFREWLFLNGNSKLRYLIDFTDNVFETAHVTSAILVLDKKHRDGYKVLKDSSLMCDSSFYERVNSRKVVEASEKMRATSDIEASIKEKYELMKLQSKVSDYSLFRGGIKTGGKHALTVDKELYLKYPELVKKAMDCRHLIKGEAFYIVCLPSGLYKNEKAIPSEVLEILKSRKDELEKRDSTVIGDEWYSVKYEDSKFLKEINCGIVNVSDRLKAYDMEAGVLPIDANIIVGNAPDWLKVYMNSKVLTCIYNICSDAGRCRNSDIPRKTAAEINEIPVPFSIAGKENISDSDIINAFGLEDREVVYIMSLLEEP